MSEQKSKWRHVGEEAALAHELYGVGGWLPFGYSKQRSLLTPVCRQWQMADEFFGG